MGIFDEISKKAQSVADQNNDGRVSKEDLEALRGNGNDERINQLKEKADRNGDGKVDMNDLGDLKNKFTRN